VSRPPKGRRWLVGKLSNEIERALGRLERTEDVVAVAVMPDVHLAEEVCVGTVTATRTRLIPAAAGGDIGCGMQALAFDREAEPLGDDRVAARLLERIGRRVPILAHSATEAVPLPGPLDEQTLTSPPLEALRRRQAGRQLGTLGRGNHFVEAQADEQGRLWALVHTGSRTMGPAIRDHHLRGAQEDRASRLRWLDARTQAGIDYLRDLEWARAYARANRDRIMTHIVEALRELLGASPLRDTSIDTDHDHVQRETHFGEPLWVHRKGAQSARPGEPGIIPGSMGSASYHVLGRGHPAALCSSSHGAGRLMSRSVARRSISRKELQRELMGIRFDPRRLEALREEAPSAYKPIHEVMRAQRKLVRISRRLRPLVVYKGG